MTVRSDERKEFLTDIVSAAVEGGIDYWAETRNYKWGTDDGEFALNGLHPYASIEVRARADEDEPPAQWQLVNEDTMAHGIRVMLSAGFLVSPKLRSLLSEADRGNDAGDIDTDVADDIVQAAMFGELVYA